MRVLVHKGGKTIDATAPSMSATYARERSRLSAVIQVLKRNIAEAKRLGRDPGAMPSQLESYENELRRIPTNDERNHLGEREYRTYGAWRAAAKAAGATRFDGDKDIASAIRADGRHVGEWGGDVGSIYTLDGVSEDWARLHDIRRSLAQLSSKAAQAGSMATDPRAKQAASRVEHMLDECRNFIHGLPT